MMAIGDEPRIQGEVVDLVSQEPAGSLAIVEPQEIAQQIAKKRRTMHEITIQDFDDHKLDVALRTWPGLLDEMGESTGLFKQIMSCENNKIADRPFNFAFFGKPSSTLAKRACSLRLYVRWAHASGFKAFPLSEEVVQVPRRPPPGGSPSYPSSELYRGPEFCKGVCGSSGSSRCLE